MIHYWTKISIGKIFFIFFVYTLLTIEKVFTYTTITTTSTIKTTYILFAIKTRELGSQHGGNKVVP